MSVCLTCQHNTFQASACCSRRCLRHSRQYTAELLVLHPVCGSIVPCPCAARQARCVFECEHTNCVGKINRDMLYIVLHGSELVGVMTSPVDAAIIAKPLQADIWTCQPNSTDATLQVEPDPSDCHLRRLVEPRGDVAATPDSTRLNC